MKRTLQTLVIVFLFCTGVYAENLELDTQTASQGETVTFTVSVINAPNAVSAFGFDIKYNPAVLNYQNFQKGPLVQSGFGFFDVNETASGQIRVGGLDFGSNPIPQGSSGSLILLTFKVAENAGSGCDLTFSELKDDLKNWSVNKGSFDISPTPPGPDPVNNVPSADNKNYDVSQGKTIAILLSGSDPDGDPLTYSLVSQPTHGQLNGNPPNLQYTPDVDFSGTDSFLYKVNDGKDDSDPASVIITVEPNPPVIDGNGTSPKLSAGVSGKTFSLSWTPVIGATGYYLYYAPFPEMSPIGYMDMEELTEISAELPPGFAYYVAVQAYNEEGGMGFSDIESFMIPPVLAAPELNVSTDGNHVTLTWPETLGAEGYILYYAPYPSASAIYSGDLGNVTSLSAELPPGSAFYVMLQAYNSEGRSGYSNVEYFILKE